VTLDGDFSVEPMKAMNMDITRNNDVSAMAAESSLLVEQSTVQVRAAVDEVSKLVAPIGLLRKEVDSLTTTSNDNATKFEDILKRFMALSNTNTLVESKLGEINTGVRENKESIAKLAGMMTHMDKKFDMLTEKLGTIQKQEIGNGNGHSNIHCEGADMNQGNTAVVANGSTANGTANLSAAKDMVKDGAWSMLGQACQAWFMKRSTERIGSPPIAPTAVHDPRNAEEKIAQCITWVLKTLKAADDGDVEKQFSKDMKEESVEWFISGPSDESLEKALKNYEKWTPPLSGWEWKVERNALMAVSKRIREAADCNLNTPTAGNDTNARKHAINILEKAVELGKPSKA